MKGKMKDKITITPQDTPWEIACMMINAKYEYENMFGQKQLTKFFNIDDLRKLGEHLLNYAYTEEKGE